MNRNFNKTNAVLMVSLAVFVIFVGILIFKEAGQGSYEIDREDVIKFFSEKINEVSPEKSAGGGRWVATRFRFIDKSNVYVEYEDGSITRAFLLTLTQTVGSVPDYRIIGFFEPGPLGYKLLAGEDVASGQPQEIYEYNETARKWVKVN